MCSTPHLRIRQRHLIAVAVGVIAMNVYMSGMQRIEVIPFARMI